MSNISADGKTTALYPANAAYVAGMILRQDVEDPYIDAVIDKISLNLVVTDADRQTIVEGSAGVVSFQAANWQDGRDQWVFQPIDHVAGGFSTSGTPIENTLQATSYVSADDAVNNAPYLQYSLFFPSSGNYDMWGYGYVDGTGIYWGFNGDLTHLRQFNLGDQLSGWERIPRWTKFGNWYIPEGGLYTFEVYLGESSTTAILDQWYFTKTLNLESQLHAEDYIEPFDLSDAPYMTAVRISDSGNSVTAWLSSVNITSSGKYNYAVQNSSSTGVALSTPISIEYWQIGGDENDFAAWNYIFSDESAGSAFMSIDYGQTYTRLASG